MEGDYDYVGGILIIQALRYYTLRRYAQVEANGRTGILGTIKMMIGLAFHSIADLLVAYETSWTHGTLQPEIGTHTSARFFH